MKKTAEIGKVIDQFVSLLEDQSYFSPSKVTKLISETKAIKKSLAEVEITENVNHIYDALCQKGNKTIETIKQNKQDPKGNLQKAQVYTRYLKAANGDFKGTSTKAISTYFKFYMACAILFLALSPQYFGFILPAVMFVPIFLGVKGIKNRSYTGWMMSMSVLPVSLMTSFIWIQFGFSIMGNPEAVAAKLMETNGLSAAVAMGLTVVPPMLGVILFPCAIMMAYTGYKSRDYYI